MLSEEMRTKSYWIELIKDRYFSHIGGDLMGGLIAAIVALPLALAFGVASGMGAKAGLYGAIACGIFAAMFGGTKGQVSGPTGPMTVVAAGLVVTATKEGIGPEILFLGVILAGALQIILGMLRTGQYIHYVPYPVVSGFMTGIGLIIICLQLVPLMGPKGLGDVLESLEMFYKMAVNPIIPILEIAPDEVIPPVNTEALIVGGVTLGVIYLFPKITKVVPSTLVALIAGTGLAVVMGYDILTISDLEKIPSELPKIVLPSLHHFFEIHILVIATVQLALLGALDSLLTSVIVDKITNTRHNSDLELVGQGIGNMIAGFIGGLPGAGATMRSVVNINANGKTYLSGIVHGLILISCLIWLGPYVEMIPLACLAGILVSVGIAIVDRRGMRSIKTAPKADVAVMLIVLVLTIFADLITAVAVGICMASILFVKHLTDARFSDHGELEKWYEKWYQGKKTEDDLKNMVYVYQFNGPLFFGEARNFNKALSTMRKYPYIIMHFSNVPMIDQTGAYALEDFIVQLKKRKDNLVYLVNLTPSCRQTLLKFGIFEHLHLKKEAVMTFDDALSDIKKLEAKREKSEKKSEKSVSKS